MAKLSDIKPGEIFCFTGEPNQYWMKGKRDCLNMSRGYFERLVENIDEPFNLRVTNGNEIRSKFGWRQSTYDAWFKGAREMAERRRLK